MFSSDLESEERDGEQGSLTKLKSLSMVGNSETCAPVGSDNRLKPINNVSGHQLTKHRATRPQCVMYLLLTSQLVNSELMN